MTDDAREPAVGARELAKAQRQRWQKTYAAHPSMYGEEPSSPAVHAALLFRAAGAEDVLELGAGHGRDALHFAREGFTAQATDFSPAGLKQLRQAAQAQGVTARLSTAVHDVHEPLPLPDASVDAAFAHMLLCMALSTKDIHALAAEVRRVLRPGGRGAVPWGLSAGGQGRGGNGLRGVRRKRG
ncbi:class I SAM-dependent methyltransferase [Streptomyces sp. NPDC018019]|uniref:class I SAM-dependent methyltransferase n=1 Tax=Streptomyces sp. NPDC018019 TaxID=3365030 RepID=UPI003799BF71